MPSLFLNFADFLTRIWALLTENLKDLISRLLSRKCSKTGPVSRLSKKASRSAKEPLRSFFTKDLEARETEGTLPLCVPSLVRGASKSNLPREVLESLRAQGLTRHDILHAQTRYVRRPTEEDDGSGDLCFVDEFVLHHEVYALRNPGHVCLCHNCAQGA